MNILGFVLYSLVFKTAALYEGANVTDIKHSN